MKIILVFALFAGACIRRPLPEGQSPQTIIWEKEIILERDTIIPANATLIIKPGTVVLFGAYQDPRVSHPAFPGVELIVKGKIIARGTKARPIIFTSVNRSLARMNSWGAVNLPDATSGEFAYCRFEFAATALHCQSGTLKLANCSFFYNEIGLRFSNTDPDVTDSFFYNNGTAIQYHDASPRIVSSEISRNRVGVFCRFGSKNSKIAFSNIFNNLEYNIKLGEEQADDFLAPENYWGENDNFFALYDRQMASYLGRVIVTSPRKEKYLLDED